MAYRAAAILLSALPVLLAASSALAQPPPPKKPGDKKVDAEFDPDAKPKEPPPLAPVEPGQWGVGGKEEEGKFAPTAASRKKLEEEARAKEKEEDRRPVDLGPARFAWLDTVVGFGAMRDITNDSGVNNGKTSTTGASFVFGFTWRIADIWTLGARFPFTRASTSGPAGPYNTFATGNTELLVRPSFQITRRLRIPAQISIFIPTAQGDYFPDPDAADRNVAIAQAQMNQASSWARGWEEMPLFAFRRFGLRFGGGITYDTDSIHVTAGTKLDLMLKTGGGDPTAGYDNRTASYAWVTYASFHYGFLDGKVEPGLRAWFAYAKLPIFTMTRDYSGPQFVLEPQINGRFPVNADKSMAVRAGLGFILPVSGPLGGANAPFDAAIKGFRIDAGFEF